MTGPMAAMNVFTLGCRPSLGRPPSGVSLLACFSLLRSDLSSLCKPKRSFSDGRRLRGNFHVSLHHARSRPAVKRNFQLAFGHIRFYHDIQTAEKTPTVGSEPGCDLGEENKKLETANAQPKTNAEIRIIDYSDKDFSQHELSNSKSLEEFLQNRPKPGWATCRWIYVNGIDADVLQCLGKAKKLHRLALEDVFDTSTPTKVDWYGDHCFMEMALQKLVHLHPDQPNGTHARAPDASKNSSSDIRDPALYELTQRRTKWRTLSHREFGVSVEQIAAFLTSDGTVITIFESSGGDVLAPILKRLQSPQTVIRSSNDPSMLIQAVIDAVVDLSLPIGRAVSEAFSKLEFAVLTNPSIEQSKKLYLLRSGLTLLTDNINAIDGLVRTLIDHRAVELPPSSSMSSSGTPSKGAPTGVTISPLAQVYLQDVHDHVRTLSASTHMSIRAAENLTALIFNTIAASQNESVRQLTLVSCFFLPLTFLTGYFGMNFDPMPIVNEHSDLVFWAIATPVMVITVTLLVARARWYRSLVWMRRRRRAAGR